MDPWRAFADSTPVQLVSGMVSTRIETMLTGPFSGMAAKKKKIGKVGPVAEKKVIPVETDPSKLVNYVCGSNYMQKGEDIKVRHRNMMNLSFRKLIPTLFSYS